MLAALSKLLEARDPYLRGHSARVTTLAEPVARRLGWEDDRLAALALGGPLHDVGKLAVSERILFKTGRLNARELAEIRTHPVEGARFLTPIGTARTAIPYVLHHHERWDGRGYPHGLAGTDVPEGARLLAIADAYDAMTSERPYRAALAPDNAFAELDRCAGTQFDPTFVRAFLDVWACSAASSAR